jgi:hypothetical protein
MRKKIATGSIFQKSYKDRTGRTRKSKTWFLKFYLNGEPVEDRLERAIMMKRSVCCGKK